MMKKIFNKLFNNQKNIMSFKQGFDLTELPIVTFYQGDKKFNFLLDTGSNNSVIDSNILNQIEYTPINASSEFFGVDGNKKKVNMCNIKLTYKDTEYSYEYVINNLGKPFGNIKQESGVTLHGIIGSKFFNKFRYVLDFNELIAYSKV